MDYENKHIDQEFIDQGWQQMADILDKEMPVKKRKRRFLWIWSFGAAATVAIAVLFFNSFDANQSIQSLPIPQNAQKTIAANQKPIQPFNETIAVTPAISEKTTTSPSIAATEQKNPIINAKQSNNSKQFSTIATETFDHLNIEKSPAISNNESQSNALELSKHTTSSLSENNTVLLSKKENNLLIINKLDLLPTPLIIFDSRHETIPPPILKQRSKWNFGGYAGLVAPNFPSYRFGLSSQFNFSPQLALHIGLGYSNRKFKENISIEVETSTPAPENTTANSDPNNPDPTTSFVPTNPAIVPLTFNRFHYFDLPITLQYKISPRWGVSAGAQLSHLYSHNFQNQGQEEFASEPSVNVDLTGSSNGKMNMSTNQISYQTKPWDMAIQAGFFYQISPKLKLEANYRSSINNYLEIAGHQYNWKQMDIGIRYYFK
jgi:hypothetical protein